MAKRKAGSATRKSRTKTDNVRSKPDAYVSRGEKKEMTRQALMEAAVRVLQRRGFRATTLQAIAEEADLHVQTLYRHFPNRPALFSEMVRAQFNHFRKDAAATLDHGEDFLSFYERQLIDVVRERGVPTVRSLMELFTDPESGVSFQDVFQDYEDLLTTMFAKELGCPANDQYAENLATLLFWGNLATVRRAVAHGDVGHVTRSISGFIQSVRDTMEMYRRRQRRR